MLVTVQTNYAKHDKYNTDWRKPGLIRQIPGLISRA